MEDYNQPDRDNINKSTSAKIEGEELSYTGKGTGGDAAKLFRMKEEDEEFIDNDSDVHDPGLSAENETEEIKAKKLQKDLTAFEQGYGYATDQMGESSDESEEDGKI